jgi:hypothetical protein
MQERVTRTVERFVDDKFTVDVVEIDQNFLWMHGLDAKWLERLSPHCDDARLSLGASLLGRIFGVGARVLIVFSRSRFTKHEPCTGDVERISVLRKSEEELAGKIAGYSTQFLQFGEPFVRSGFDSMTDILDTSRKEEDDPVLTEVYDPIEPILKNHAGLVVSPLACGSRIDHRIVKHCVLRCLGEYPSSKGRIL